jgi:N12 class adenine-specific DNA methylase
MARIDRVRENYEDVTERLFSDKAAFEDYLKFAGRFFKLPSAQSMIIYGTNPKATMVADFDTWKKFNRHVKRGTNSIAVLDNGGLKHYFDISQTNGSKTPYQWTLGKDTANALIDEVYEQSGMCFKSFSGCVNYLGAEQARETAENVMNTLNVSEENRAAFEKSYVSMTQYLIAARCELGGNFKYNGNLDLSALDMLHSKAEKERLCEFVQLAGKSVLLSLEKSINNIVMQERTVDYGRSKADMVRGGQEVLSRNQDGERQEVQARPDNVRVSGADGTRSDGGRTGTDERADRTMGREVAQANGGNAPRTDTVASRTTAVGTDTPTDRPRSVGAAADAQNAVREEIPSTDRVGRVENVGEHVRSDSGQRDNGNGSAGSHRINENRSATYSTENTEQTAEEKSPAVSFSENDLSEIADIARSNDMLGITDDILALDTAVKDSGSDVFVEDYLEEHTSNKRVRIMNMLTAQDYKPLRDYLGAVFREAYENHEMLDEGTKAQEILERIDALGKSVIKDTPYVTVKPFSEVNFEKIALDENRRYTIPEFNAALAEADRLYTAADEYENRIDTFTVSLHIGGKTAHYSVLLGAEYGFLSAIMNSTDLVNPSNIDITPAEKEFVADIEKAAVLTERRNSTIHFGLLGNGITCYDVSRTVGGDYPTVAHISNEGNIKYYDENLSADDKRLIEEQAARQKREFTENWSKLPIETRYERLLDEAGVHLTDITSNKRSNGLSMVETVAKYEHSVIFKDEPFPVEKPNRIKDEDTIFDWSKYVALGAHSSYDRIIYEKNENIDTNVKISLSPKAEDLSDYALEIGIKPCTQGNQLYYTIRYDLRNEKTDEITEVSAICVDTDGVMIAGHFERLPAYEKFRAMVERGAVKVIEKIRENARKRSPEEIYKGMSDVDRTFFDANAYADILYIEGLVKNAHANKPAEQIRLDDREKMYAERFGTTHDEFRALIRYHEAELAKQTITVSPDDLRVGDYVRGYGAIWRITAIDGDFSIAFENTDKTDIRSVQSIIGHWKENFVKQGYEYVSSDEIKRTVDTVTEPVVEEDNDEEFEEIPDEPTNDYDYGEQLSLFGEPMHEVEVPEKTIIGGVDIEEALKRELIQHGTGFVDGKFRVEQFYLEHKGDTKSFAKFLSDAYGIGGHSGEGKILGVDHNMFGVRGIVMRIALDNGEETRVSWNWNKVANRIATLIDKQEYITQRDIDERISRAKREMAHNGEDSDEYKRAADILDNYGLLPAKEDVQRVQPSEIKAGDSFMYHGNVVTVTNDKGIYPDDIVITREDKVGGVAFAVTENVNIERFLREAKRITTERNEPEQTEEQAVKQERTETAAPERTEEPPVDIKNLAQLKRALTVGAEFEITSYIRGDVVNQWRRVKEADTVAIYSIRPDAPDDEKTTLANHGRGSYLPWEKASDWGFANGVCTAYRKGTEHTEENRLLSIKVRPPVHKQERGEEKQQTAEITNPLIKELAKTFPADTAERLYNAFEGAKMADWQSNQAKINRVKRALYDILRNEEQTESAFSVLSSGEMPKLKDIVIDLSPRTNSYEREEIPEQARDGDMSDKLNKIAQTANDKIDYTITDEHLGEGGTKEKFAANIAAIKTLKRIESRNLHLAADMFRAHNAEPDEQKILAGYVGWGGLSQAFDPNNKAWAKEYQRLKELLTDEEYAAAKGSTLNAHYTTPTVINAIYKGLQNLGFEGGNILEPAMGVGNFFGAMPEEIRKNSHLSGVELDSITGRIAQQLYQNADVQVKGFEKTDFSDNFFDAAVGNVPFGSYPVSDKRYNRENFFIHDYFLAKTLDKLAPCGVAALITTKGTLDKENPKVREYLAKRADLIGAIRLPNTAFKANAGTEVTTDILFLQKREKMAVEMPDWCYIAQDNNGVPVNQYFLDHPEMVLGTMKQGLEFSLYGNPNETACVPIEGADLKQQLEAAVANLKTNNAIRKHSEQRKAEAGVIAATEDVRNFTFAEVDGKMYFRENNIMTEAADKNGNALTGKSLDRIRALNELRQTFRTILTAQENNCSDAQLETYQKILNAQYDALVKKYGYINDRANYQAFSKDDDYNSLCALEIINEETHEVTKSAFFSKRTVKHVTEITHVDTPQEALFVSVDTLGKLDIPYMAKLCGKEPDEVIDALKADNLIYLNPKKANPEKPYEGWEEASEYLSGNVRVKLRAAERAAEGNPDLQRNVDALKAVIPQKLEAGDITARIGVHWVDVEDYQKFLQEYAKAHFTYGEPLRRAYNGEYKIPFKGRDYSKAATEIFGTKRMNSLEIFENLLNNRDVVVKDKKIDPDGKEHYEINKKETELAQDKASKMKEAFKRWLWEEPERREKYVTRYNELFNCIVGRKYDGSHQTFPGMSPSISLKPHQLDAVARAKFGGNTLLAHCVGAGKSFEMVAATMEKKRLGLINKACVVVPKALVGQMASEWLRLYPQAKILTATEKDFDKDHRQKFIGRCCTGDYDAVVMSYEQFEKIPMSFEYRRDFIQREINTLTSGIDDLKSNGGRNENSGSIKDMERVKKRLEARLEKLIEDNGKTKDTSLNFEQLGFDSIVVDEAHNYKNGLVVTKMQRVAGVQTTPAQKSEDILMKTQYLNENYGERNLLFATGTPVSNSMSELYIMQRYLRPSLLAQAGLQTFDDWASTFGEVVSKAEMKPAGNGYRTKKRFAKFNNLPELMAMYKEFADMRTADMLNLPVPKIKGGKPETIVAEPNDFQKAYMKVLAERSEQVHSGAVDATKDNMLKITGEARLLGLDVRCLNPEAPNYPDSKVNLLVQKVMEIYTQTTPQKGVQAIFCDIAVHGDNETEELSEGNEQKSKKPKAEKSEDGKFSVYNYIKAELIRRGIPADEICFAGDADTVKKQNEMKAQLRSGTKRIVLSSTSKLGTGANIQNKLVALHNLDIPWKPSDLEQRLGRIVRQGNENEEVGIYNYVTKDTFDAYMMNIIVTKQKFISQLNTTTSRSCEDVDDLVLNYSEIQAMAVGDERIKEKIELDMDVSRLKMLESEHYNEQYRLDDTIADAQKLMKNLTRNIEAAKNDLAFAQENRYLPENFKVEIGGKVYTDRKEAGTAIREAAVEFMANDNGAVRQPIGTFCGFELSVGKNHGSFGGATAEIVIRHGISYATDMDLTGDIGNTTRLENLFGGGIEKKIADLEERAERTNADLQAALANKGKPFEHAEELAQKSARLEQLNLELEVGKVDEVIIADDEPEQGEPDRNEKRHGKDAPDNDRDKPTPPKRGHR